MRPRSRTLAAWLAVLGGALGAHRFYLHGLRDPLGWLFVPPTLAGLVGAWRLQNLGQDDRYAWALLPLLGLTIAAAMLAAIVIALTSEERWALRFGQPPRRAGWAAVIAAIVALLIGATALMSALAYGIERFFEWQLKPAQTASAPAPPQVSSHRPT
ncbi:MAG: NINE protein [Rubrivivax sp.]